MATLVRLLLCAEGMRLLLLRLESASSSLRPCTGSWPSLRMPVLWGRRRSVRSGVVAFPCPGPG